MSTGLECMIIELEPEKWYLAIEQRGGSKFDWLESALAEGPFSAFHEALEHLDANHANPGGFTQVDYDPEFDGNERLQNLAKRATAPAKGRRW